TDPRSTLCCSHVCVVLEKLLCFPTRRSSDLAEGKLKSNLGFVQSTDGIRFWQRINVPDRNNFSEEISQSEKFLKAFTWEGMYQTDRKSTRLELQSRENLVCRLLLEQKKLSL